MSQKILLLLCLISFSFTFKMKIVENYFVEVYFGFPMRKLKLLVDPISPYSYILNRYYSNTKEKKDISDSLHFTNAYGEFTGVWVKDKIYLSEDQNFNFEFKFLDCFFQRTLLNVDGVLGLGYSKDYEDASIYYYLKKMSGAFSNVKNVMTYDKRNNIFSVGEYADTPVTHKPIELSLIHHQKYAGEYVDLKRIYVCHEELDLNDPLLLGLMPIIVAPKSREQWLKETYFPHLLVEGSETKVVHDAKKLYSEIYATKFKDNEHPYMQIEDLYFEYEYYRIRNNSFKSNIRIGDVWQNPMECWYIGLPTIYIDRADFDFENYKVTMYRQRDFEKSYIQAGVKIAFFTITTILLIIVVIYILRIKPPKKNDRDRGTELRDF